MLVISKLNKLQKDVTVYKGDKKLAHETDATGAVGLGDASLFQSFMVCSEYSPTRTRLSFSKVAAGWKRWFCKILTWILRWDDQRGSGDQHFPPNWRWGRQHPTLLLLVWNRGKRSSSEFLVLWYTMVVKMPSLRTSNTKELQRSLCMGFLPVYHNISSS